MTNAWLVSAMGSIRTYGGNDGYDDEPEHTYRWDSNVPNARGPQEGDFIVLRDKYVSLGASVIERLYSFEGNKTLSYCPECNNPEINIRTTMDPRYRCGKCKSTFDSPLTKNAAVTKYEASYGEAWVSLYGYIKSQDLFGMCHSLRTQHSIRLIDWEMFRSRIVSHGLDLRLPEGRQKHLTDGRSITTLRVRNGQAAFRQKLLNNFGPICAITGPIPPEALDAVNLYSYSIGEKHQEHGGLLVRKDLHRLIDTGRLCVDPVTLLIDSPGLMQYASYSQFHGSRMKVKPSASQLKWIQDHWALHRQQV